MVLSLSIIILILDDASAFTIYTESKARSKLNFNYINVAVYPINSGSLLDCEKFHTREIIIKASLSRDLSIILISSM